MWISSTFGPSFNNFSTCFANHSLKLFFINTLQWLLTAKFDSWNKWIIFAGTLHKYMLRARSMSNTSTVIWSWNMSMLINAAWLGNCNDLHCFSTYGAIISSVTLTDSAQLLKWLGLTLRENKSGNLNRGKLCAVLLTYISCASRKSPLSVMSY